MSYRRDNRSSYRGRYERADDRYESSRSRRCDDNFDTDKGDERRSYRRESSYNDSNGDYDGHSDYRSDYRYSSRSYRDSDENHGYYRSRRGDTGDSRSHSRSRNHSRSRDDPMSDDDQYRSSRDRDSRDRDPRDRGSSLHDSASRVQTRNAGPGGSSSYYGSSRPDYFQTQNPYSQSSAPQYLNTYRSASQQHSGAAGGYSSYDRYGSGGARQRNDRASYKYSASLEAAPQQFCHNNASNFQSSRQGSSFASGRNSISMESPIKSKDTFNDENDPSNIVLEGPFMFGYANLINQVWDCPEDPPDEVIGKPFACIPIAPPRTEFPRRNKASKNTLNHKQRDVVNVARGPEDGEVSMDRSVVTNHDQESVDMKDPGTSTGDTQPIEEHQSETTNMETTKRKLEEEDPEVVPTPTKLRKLEGDTLSDFVPPEEIDQLRQKRRLEHRNLDAQE